MVNIAAILQLTAALLATFRAVALRRMSAAAPWFLASVLWSDVVNDWANRLINAHLPLPGGPPLVGFARAGAHVGIAIYAAWVCTGLVFVGWLARRRFGFVGVTAGGVVWVAFVAANVLTYPETRGDAALRALGALHIAVFVIQLPCLAVMALDWDKKQETEQICSIWLVFLGVAAGFGALLPWKVGGIDRVAAERSIGTAMMLMYAWIIATILAGGGKWIRCVTSWGSLRLRS